MPRFIMFVRSAPREGHEAEFEAWYEKQHVPDLMRIPGFVSARRYAVVSEREEWTGSYLGVYEVETDSPEELEAEIGRRRGTTEMPMNREDVDPAQTIKIYARPVGATIVKQEGQVTPPASLAATDRDKDKP